MNGNPAIKCDVAVIGAGPAGLSFARSLAGTGLNIILAEKLPAKVLAAPPMDGRDIALTHLSVGILKELDVWPLFPAGSISAIKEARVLNGQSPYFLHFDHNDTDKTALGYIVSNHLIRKALYKSLDGFSNIRLITGVEATSVTTDSNHASLRLSNGQTITASLIVAADSRFSETRRKIGISASMHDFGRTVIVCRMKHEKPHNGIAYECFHYQRTLAVLPLGGNKSSIVVTLPTNMSEALMTMSKAAFNEDIRKRFDNRLGKMELISKRFPYPLVAVHANRFATTRFALIGDAAVGMHPVTAHGFNLGLRGQNTLAKNIRSALERNIDIGSPAVLENYGSTHRRATWPLYMGTNALVKLYTSDGLHAKIARVAMLRLGNNLRPIKRTLMTKLTEAGSLPG
jgi:ubiquinone biosynthesis UbiH/UbiF/VisC/COQ6 family hydroxylase